MHPRSGSSPVLLIVDVVHPLHSLAVQSFLNRNMRQSRSRRSSVPMLLSRRKPNHIARVNLLNRTALPLNPATARSHNQSLPQRMRMPRSTRSRFERNAGSTNERRIRRLKERVNPNCSGKPLCRTFARRLRTAAFDLHGPILVVHAEKKFQITRNNSQTQPNHSSTKLLNLRILRT